jgi:hypothetical protein
MALMLSRLYDALRLANVPEDKAREAAEEVATYEQVKKDTILLKWMMGVLIALVLGVFWMQWQTIARMGEFQGVLSGVQAGLTSVQGQLADVKGQLAGVERGLGEVDGQLTTVDDRLGRVEARLEGIESERSPP